MNNWGRVKDAVKIVLVILFFAAMIVLFVWRSKTCIERTGYPFCTITTGGR